MLNMWRCCRLYWSTKHEQCQDLLNSWQQMKVLDWLIQHKTILQLLTSMSHCQEKKSLPLSCYQGFVLFFLVCRYCNEGPDQLRSAVCVSVVHRRGQAALPVRHWGEVDLKLDIHQLGVPSWCQQLHVDGIEYSQMVFIERLTGPLLCLSVSLSNTHWLESPIAATTGIQQNIYIFFFSSMNCILCYRLCWAYNLALITFVFLC